MGYIDNIVLGVLIFPFIAALVTFPYALHQYHKYGSVYKYRTLIIYSFILYMMIVFFMVSLPLPERASTVGNQWRDHLNLIPCRQIWLYWHSRQLNAETFAKYLRYYFYAYFFCEVFRKEARPMPHDRLSGTKYISI